jgi:hypothetical protein
MINQKIIMIINFTLITLIIYDLFKKTNRVTEPLASCNKNKNDLVYKQEAKIDRLFGELNNIKNGITIIKGGVKNNENLIKSNTIELKRSSNKVNKGANREMKKLDKLG